MLFQKINLNLDQTPFQGLLKKSGKSSAFPTNKAGLKYLSCKKSDDGKAILYQVYPSSSATIAKYQFIHEHGRGSLFFSIYHLPKLSENLDKLILSKAKSGNLSKAESYWRKKKNIDTERYTHRLQISRMKKERQIYWIIDIDFRQSYSYGSNNAVEILKSLLLFRLNKSFIASGGRDRLDTMLAEDWVEAIAHTAEKFDRGFSKDRIKLIYGVSQNSLSKFKNQSN
jgi:hypothetical protein